MVPTHARLAVALLPWLLAAAAAQAQTAATTLPAAAATSADPRPKVGLVLGGGGARGAAHVGVLEVLEQLRVPVDCVAGTSVGALVAGAWAAGRSPAQMRAELAQADWGDMFLDNPGYIDLDFRNKRLSRRYLPGSEAGVGASGLITPPGVVLGQKIKLFLNQMVNADTGEPQIEALPLPLSIIAADVGTGQRVVYREGSLTQAMRASMSVPGLMAPLEYRGRKLVDGGLVDNLPVREVHERCGAQVVIAVNVGSPTFKAEDISGLLSITAQMVALLTEQNLSASLELLQPHDILVKPDLGSITAGDFARHAEAADRGHAAALALADRLAPLAVDAATYAAWRRQVAVRESDAPRIDEVQVAAMLRVDEAQVRRWLSQRLGQPLDTAALTRDLGRVYGEGHYERLDYTVRREGDRHLLRVLPVEKGWGPNYLRLGVQLDTNLSQGSSYLLRAGYQRTWINALGGELLLAGELGSTTSVGAEWYQPLSTTQRTFVEAVADYRRERVDYFDVEQRVAEYRSARSRLDLLAGVNIDRLGQARAGWRMSKVTNQLETGIDLFRDRPGRRFGGWLLSLQADRMDSLYFPSSGWAAQLDAFAATSGEFSRLGFEARAVLPWRPYVVGTRLTWTGSLKGQLPLQEAARLGGFLNLTGFASGQLVGDDVGYAHVRTERIIGRLPLGLRGDMRLGVALETGRVGQPYTRQKRGGWLNSVALYLGGETPLGSVYVGIGRGSGGTTNAYLFLGTP